MDIAKELDQWYTKPEVAKRCVEIMYELGFLYQHTDVIEPSAGEGVFIDIFTKYVDHTHIHAFDIDPKRDDIEKRDWLAEEPIALGSRTVIIGNPPYGKKGTLAVEFINRSLDIADVLGFIVPITLQHSYIAQKKVREDAELIYWEKLPKNAFNFKGKEKNKPSVFQVWRHKFKDLRMKKPQTEHPDLKIRIYNKTERARRCLNWDWDIAVKRNSNKGEFILKPEKATDDTHWILIKGPIDKLTKINWSKINDNKMTAGMGKADIVQAYKEIQKVT